MNNQNEFLLVPALCCALVLTACSSANKDWATASNANTVAAYQSFLAKHADDPHANEAKAYMLALQDDAAWRTAQNGNSLDSYQQYLGAEPNGSHAQSAHEQVAELERANAWKNTQSDGTATALQAYLQKYPQGPEADQARQKLAALNSSYRAELGAFHNEHAAERKRSELQSRFSGLLKKVEVLSPDSSDKRYRVMSGPMDRHEAASTCASLKRDHQSCEVVKAEQQQS
jgi:cell division septation protein DedD